MLIKYTKKMFLDYASAFDYYDEMKETMKSWGLKQFHDFYGFTHKDWESGQEIKPKKESKIMENKERYKIVKFRKSGTQTVLKRNLSFNEAKRYCNRPDTKGKNWFCGFTKQ